MTIQINESYIFTAETNENDFEDEIIEDHYDMGRLSDEIWNHFDYWSHLNGVKVVCLSLMKDLYGNGNDDLAKVYIPTRGLDWWFTAKASELSSLNAKINPISCSCPLNIIMLRGCLCGGE